MPTKAERILALLPRTFEVAVGKSALRAVADAFGTELLKGENTLAELMRAHWVDHADKGAEEIKDLALFAALYGLAPREDESVEEFREHLKRYVRTFLEGTSTVQGILRVTAEVLGLRIEDDNEKLDSWWRRPGDELATVDLRGDDAADLLFGVRSFRVTGAAAVPPVPSVPIPAQPARPARVTGTVDLAGGIDLTAERYLRIALNGSLVAEVDAAGPDPANTTLDQVRDRINAALGAGVASHDGHFLTLTSPTQGFQSTIAFLEPAAQDARVRLFGPVAPFHLGADAVPEGAAPEGFQGSAATRARFTSTRDFAAGVPLWGRCGVILSVDGGAPVEIELSPAQGTLDDVAAALNAALGAGVASHDGRFLTLASPTEGPASALALVPGTVERRRRFVTRAFITDEAATALLGFARAEARGEVATRARVAGKPDLSRGVDLRQEHFLRIAVDGAPAVDIDCAGERPRATTLAEVVAKINGKIAEIASHDGKHLLLASPTIGAGSRIAFEPPQAADALSTILGVPPGVTRGQSAATVRFVATVDLSAGVDLPAGARIQLAVDGAPGVEIPLAEGGPVHASLSQIVNAVNVAIGGTAVASHDGIRLHLASREPGGASRLAFEVPSSNDVTSALFGIAPPRVYQGKDAAPARVTGEKEWAATEDLKTARFLRLGVDGKPLVEVDCAAGAADPEAVSLGEVVTAINAALPGIASAAGNRLVLTSPSQGFSSRVTLERHSAPDARRILLGGVPDETAGTAPAPAVITGSVDLLKPADLSRRRALRIAVDGGAPQDVDVAGAAPGQTFLNEVVAALNAQVPGLASATEDDRLRLTSPTAGEGSRLEVLPLRVLEVEEYPPDPAEVTRQVMHGGSFTVLHPGAADAPVEIEIRAAAGVLAPGLVNRTAGWSVRVLAALAPGEKAILRRDPSGAVQGEIVGTDGVARPLPASALAVQAPALTISRGRTVWAYVEGLAARFDAADFDEARFAGFPCTEAGIFDSSFFAPADPVSPVFGPVPSGLPVEVVLRWASHRPGAFTVNLPADLPPRFGGRFDEARFGVPEPEKYEAVVTEPANDARHVVTLLPKEGGASKLVWAAPADRVPLGFVAAPMPFRKPRFLTLGSATQEARLYLTEPGVPGAIRIQAREPGAWGNEIAVVTRPAGPGAYDVLVSFAGARFENARQVVLGPPLPELAEDLMKPGPIGLLHAKAAGVEARVTRDRTEIPLPKV